MSQDVFKAPKAKRKHGNNHKRDPERWSPKKKRRTKEDFNAFCSIVLEYTQYETLKQEELRRCNNTSPLDSAGSTADSFTSESTSSSISESEHDDKFLEGTTPQLVASHMAHDENSNSSFTKPDHDEDDDDDDDDDDDVNDSRDVTGQDSPGAMPRDVPKNVRGDVRGDVREERSKRASRSDKSDSSNDDSADEDSWELVTCYCMKPFSGRPMIECSECLTWIHLSCAKIRKSNIPDDFVCQKCRESKFTMRKSSRIRSEKKMINA